MYKFPVNNGINYLHLNWFSCRSSEPSTIPQHWQGIPLEMRQEVFPSSYTQRCHLFFLDGSGWIDTFKIKLHVYTMIYTQKIHNSFLFGLCFKSWDFFCMIFIELIWNGPFIIILHPRTLISKFHINDTSNWSAFWTWRTILSHHKCPGVCCTTVSLNFQLSKSNWTFNIYTVYYT